MPQKVYTKIVYNNFRNKSKIVLQTTTRGSLPLPPIRIDFQLFLVKGSP